MRNRHLPRLCASCGRPMAVQEAACWSCGARASGAESPALTVLLLPLDTERWMTDGGRFDDAAAMAAVGE